MENKTTETSVLTTCDICGKPTFMRTAFPSGKEIKIKVKCDCDAELERKDYERLLKLENERKVEELKRLSILDGDSNIDNGVHLSDLKVIPDNKEALTFALEFVDNFTDFLADHTGILLYGDVGTGKSYLAKAISNELLDKGFSVLATRFGMILDLKKDFSKQHPELNRLNAVDLLVLDDLGVENETPFAMETIFEVIDARYRSGKPLIVTTNLSFDEIKNTHDMKHKRIYDRILEMCVPVAINGKSWRIRKAMANIKTHRTRKE